MNRFKAKIGFLALALMVFLGNPLVHAADFPKDLSIAAADVNVPGNLITGQSAKLYVTVHNNSKSDLAGVVKFFDEKTGQFIGSDQPISAVAGKTDDVFIDWSSDQLGDHPIAVRIVPWDAAGDNPDNNKVTKNLYVDIDSDLDGTGNRIDTDDDNDNIFDNQDALPLDPRESRDFDRDGIGDNADPDDDNDTVADVQDAFPTDSAETKDSDGDKIGDNQDVFPFDPKESKDSDQDGKGDSSDPQPSNHSPIPVIQASKSESQVGESITFNGLKSSDPDDSISGYTWDFGDAATAQGVIVDHSFSKPGRYLVTLKATDARGESDERQMQIIVARNWALPALLVATALLILLIIGMLIPGSRFHHSQLFSKKKAKKGAKK